MADIGVDAPALLEMNLTGFGNSSRWPRGVARGDSSPLAGVQGQRPCQAVLTEPATAGVQINKYEQGYRRRIFNLSDNTRLAILQTVLHSR